MSNLIAQLQETIKSSVLTDLDAMQGFRQDHCLMAEAGQPTAVVRAESVEDVIATLRAAARFDTPVVTRGTGTGLAGGANALNGCVVLSMERMNRILAIDPVARTAQVQAGVINGDLDRAARSQGLFYPPDPGSRGISSIGGNLATNAGGMCCAKYGVTSDHALALTAVLAGGDVIRTGSLTLKDVAGLDLTHLLVGSEGTLAVIVEATLKLRPVPNGVSTVAATFPTVHDAISAALAFCDAANPSAVEILDQVTVKAINSMTSMGLDERAGATMLIQCDGQLAASETAAISAAAHRHRAIEVVHTDDPIEGEAFMRARRAAFPALERLGTTLLDDVCVQVHRLPELMLAIESVAARYDVLIGTFGHAADGNLHPTIVFDPTDHAARVRAQSAFDAIVLATLELGGTISGEHGIGSLKTRWLTGQIGITERHLMQRIKTAFDPGAILNPGRGY